MNESGISSVREQGGTMDATEDAKNVLRSALRGVTLHVRKAPWGDDYWSHTVDANSLYKIVDLVLETLTSPRAEKCDADGCDNGLVYYGTDEHGGAEPCASCSGSGRIEKGPIAYLAESLEQVGWMDMEDGDLLPSRSYDGPRDDDWTCVYTDLVYRLPDESPKGGA